MRKFNFYFGAAASSLLLAILVIAAELSASFKALLTNVFSHHWLAKLVLVVLAFIAVGFLLGNKDKALGLKDESIGWYSVLLSIAVIFLFYLLEFLR